MSSYYNGNDYCRFHRHHCVFYKLIFFVANTGLNLAVDHVMQSCSNNRTGVCHLTPGRDQPRPSWVRKN